MTLQRHPPSVPECCGAVLLGLGLAACTTTGDPTTGGLFGWSRPQAEARQSELVRRSDAAEQEADNARRDTAALHRQRDQVAAEASQLQQQLDRLVGENHALATRLQALMQRQVLSAGELARLQKVVADNEAVRRGLAVPAAAGGGPRRTPTSTQLDSVGDQNSRLHREIMILMQR